VDALRPVSAVAPLPPGDVETQFYVSWGGSDVGSGVRDYTVHVAIDSSQYSVWLRDTPAVSAAFAGERGHTYAFFSIARDSVGNVEDAPAVPDAQIKIRDLVGVGEANEHVFALKGVVPNPADGHVRVAFELPSWIPGALDLYDVAGRRIIHREIGGLGPGQHLVSLGERSRVEPGIYFVRLRQGRSIATKKIVVAR